MPAERRDVLPISLPPRGLHRVQAAAYIGVSPTLFDQMVADGRMPPARKANSRTVWDRLALDIYFENLPSDGPEDGSPSTWD